MVPGQPPLPVPLVRRCLLQRAAAPVERPPPAALVRRPRVQAPRGPRLPWLVRPQTQQELPELVVRLAAGEARVQGSLEQIRRLRGRPDRAWPVPVRGRVVRPVRALGAQRARAWVALRQEQRGLT